MKKNLVKKLKIKNKMLGCVAHDLRSPINASIFCLSELKDLIKPLFVILDEIIYTNLKEIIFQINNYLDFTFKN